MIGFLLKKTFFDMWDNMFRIALLNLGFIASVCVPVFVPALIPIPVPAMAVFAAGTLWCCVYLSAAALSLKAISDYQIFGFGDFFHNLKEGLPAGIFLGAAAFAMGVMVRVVIPFYLGMRSILGLFLAAVIFWVLFALFGSLQYFFAVRARLDTKLLKVFKKCVIIFFDNTGFSLFAILHNLVVLAFSFLLALVFPGPAGVILFLDEALRLRLLKYDWLEANPEANPQAKRRSIPWDAILIEEREKTGTRSFKSFIFPWKD